jgi:hypothetical protein
LEERMKRAFKTWLKELPDEEARQLWIHLDSGMISDVIDVIANSHLEVRKKLCGEPPTQPGS